MARLATAQPFISYSVNSAFFCCSLMLSVLRGILFWFSPGLHKLCVGTSFCGNSLFYFLPGEYGDLFSGKLVAGGNKFVHTGLVPSPRAGHSACTHAGKVCRPVCVSICAWCMARMCVGVVCALTRTRMYLGVCLSHPKVPWVHVMWSTFA